MNGNELTASIVDAVGDDIVVWRVRLCRSRRLTGGWILGVRDGAQLDALLGGTWVLATATGATALADAGVTPELTLDLAAFLAGIEADLRAAGVTDLPAGIEPTGSPRALLIARQLDAWCTAWRSVTGAGATLPGLSSTRSAAA